jgi:CRP-like cAMP-binding protein
MAFFDNEAPKTRMAHVAAVETSLILVIMDYSIRDLAKRYPEIYQKIQEVIRKRNEENAVKLK